MDGQWVFGFLYSLLFQLNIYSLTMLFKTFKSPSTLDSLSFFKNVSILSHVLRIFVVSCLTVIRIAANKRSVGLGAATSFPSLSCNNSFLIGEIESIVLPNLVSFISPSTKVTNLCSPLPSLLVSSFVFPPKK